MIANDFIHECKIFDIVKTSEVKISYFCVVCGKELVKKIYPHNAKYFADSSLPDLV